MKNLSLLAAKRKENVSSITTSPSSSSEKSPKSKEPEKFSS